MNPKYIKTIKKVLIIVCAVLVLAAVVITAFRFIESKKDDRITEEKNKQDRYSQVSYRLNEVGELYASDVNLADYEPVSQFGQFYVLDNSELLEQSLEFTYNTAVDNEYFVDNRCFSCEFDGKSHYFFFGEDEDNLPFYLKISSKWDKSEWYVRKDFIPPTAKLNRVSEIIVISESAAEELLSKSLGNSDLRRINADEMLKITDKDKIKQCVSRYQNGKYAYDEKFDSSIAEAKEKTMCGYILAGFENSNVYQCIGVY